MKEKRREGTKRGATWKGSGWEMEGKRREEKMIIEEKERRENAWTQ
jgi:hypothetical protein